MISFTFFVPYNEKLAENTNANNDMVSKNVTEIEDNKDVGKQNFLLVRHLSKTYIGGYSGKILMINKKVECQKLLLHLFCPLLQALQLRDYSSGRTTILSVLAGLESISSGEMYLNGKLLNNAKIKDCTSKY